MTDTPPTTAIHQVGTVFVPVADSEQALAFYVQTLGFEKRADFPYGDSSRWIEVAPPGAANTIALVPPSEGAAAGGDQTLCAFHTTDIAADHARFRAAGVDVDPEIGREGTPRPGLMSRKVTVRDPQPPQFLFRDPDGNRFLIVESA